jgi:short chain dehydrogenase
MRRARTHARATDEPLRTITPAPPWVKRRIDLLRGRKRKADYMPGKFDGRWPFVTGGSSGIGEAAARLLAADGAHVALADVQEELGQQVAESLRAAGGEALFVRCDVAARARSTRRSTRSWSGRSQTDATSAPVPGEAPHRLVQGLPLSNGAAFDPETNTWERIAQAPVAIGWASGAEGGVDQSGHAPKLSLTHRRPQPQTGWPPQRA